MAHLESSEVKSDLSPSRLWSPHIWCQVAAAIIAYLLLLLANHFMSNTSTWFWNTESSVTLAIAIGFGQLTIIAIWLQFDPSHKKITLGIVAVSSEILAILYLSASTVSHLGFAIVCSFACVVHFLLNWCGIKAISKIFNLSLKNDEPKLSDPIAKIQYKIRDILALMLVVACFASALKATAPQWKGDLRLVVVFAFIICFYLAIGWSASVACLSRRWRTSVMISVVVIIATVLAQAFVFFSMIGIPPDETLFLFNLDIPFAGTIIVHSLIARRYGYRLTITRKNRQLDGLVSTS